MNYKTQKEHIKEAIEELELSIDTFPDKDDEIRRTNDAIYGIISTLKIFINDIGYE